MSSFLRRLPRIFIILVFVFIGVMGAVLAFLHSPFFEYPTDGEYPPPRINELIWPTIGCPAMVVPGEVLEVEVDLDLDATPGHTSQLEDASGWKATIVPSRDELAGLSYELIPQDAYLSRSDRWTYRGADKRDESGEVWHAEFLVPEEVGPELYDLRVEVDAGGRRISDGQPHSVAVVEDNDNDFTFITLSDIHVHERDNSSPFSTQTNKGIAEDGEPLFFEEAIAQVNLIRPDFVLMLGDYVRGQRRPGELLSEYERFYAAMLELEVPAFLIPGNHDGYINEIDGKRWYEENLGPLRFSFDMGDCRFICLDSYQWPEEDRVVMNKFFYMEPRKWQGQVLEETVMMDGRDVFIGQLGWLLGELDEGRNAPLKVVAMHHDPYTPDGKGFSFIDVHYYGVFRFGGGGEGREALISLASGNEVDMVFGGHLHTDELGAVPWDGGGGETLYSCQTCVYFDQGGESDHYPGYRLVEVEDGEIASFSYLDGVSSYPFYDGSVPGGTTDLDGLDIPSLDVEIVQAAMEGSPSTALEAENYLAVDMELAGIVVEMPPSPTGGYEVEGGEIYRVVDIPGRPGWVLLYLRTEIGPGDPAVKTVTIEPGRD